MAGGGEPLRFLDEVCDAYDSPRDGVGGRGGTRDAALRWYVDKPWQAWGK